MSKDTSSIKWTEFVSGNNNSYSWLYRNYVKVLYNYGLRFTNNKELINDCIQEIFTYLYPNRSQLVTPDNVKVYLLISFKNNLIKMLTHESKLNHEQIDNIDFMLVSTVEDDFIDQESYNNQQQKIHDLLSLLSPRQKEILYYRYIQELSFDEICSIMDINYQSAQNLIQRSLTKIRESNVDKNLLLLALSISMLSSN